MTPGAAGEVQYNGIHRYLRDLLKQIDSDARLIHVAMRVEMRVEFVREPLAIPGHGFPPV